MNNNQGKKWYLSKTIWLAVLQGLAGVVLAVLSIHPELAWALILKSVIDFVLRQFTEMPIK